jgi:hypothetical protein
LSEEKFGHSFALKRPGAPLPAWPDTPSQLPPNVSALQLTKSAGRASRSLWPSQLNADTLGGREQASGDFNDDNC